MHETPGLSKRDSEISFYPVIFYISHSTMHIASSTDGMWNIQEVLHVRMWMLTFVSDWPGWYMFQISSCDPKKAFSYC